MIEPSSAVVKSNSQTLGEELFLVHLRRQRNIDSDDDERNEEEKAPERKRSKSIGEELFGVHLTRSKGLLPQDTREENDKLEITDTLDRNQEALAKKKCRKNHASQKIQGHFIVTRARAHSTATMA
mmetsp:Transcript_12342/g.17753  ORF Transcript_12342/g.17753 Transcript_12342/m.17753 type:complete len:126 (+) Transcript_12342:114-491(+)